MNKYQEALDWLKTRENWNGMCYEELQVDIRYDEKFKTLQELIDLYNNESKYESFAEIYKEHQEEIAKLEKALDKSLDMYFRKGTYLFPNKEALKKYLLESEK